jgi:hypothetical protein
MNPTLRQLLLNKKRPIISDTFTRDDSTTTLDKADTGQIWVQPQGVWGVFGNQAYLSTSSEPSVAVIESEIANCKVSCILPAIPLGEAPGLVARYVDTSNYLRISITVGTGMLYLSKRVAGTLTTLGTYTHDWITGDTIGFVLNGASVQATLNGNVVITVMETACQTATKHGLAKGGGILATTRWDNFKVEAL